MKVERHIIRVGARLAPALLAGALSGCALGENLSKPEIALPQAFEAPQAASDLPPVALDRWWLLFGDPQLTSLIDQALAFSPDAKSAFYRLAEARADRAEIIAGVFPQGDIKANAQDEYAKVNFSHVDAAAFGATGIGGATATGATGAGSGTSLLSSFFGAQNGSTQTYSAAFNVSWEIDLYGKNFTAIKAADANFAAARFDYEATRLSLAAEVATDLFQARGLAVQLDDARENEKLAKNLADVARRKADAGLATTADSARTESDAESNAAQTVLIEAQLRAAQRALLVLIGKGGAPSSDLVVTANVTPPPAAPATTPGSLLARRPDVREAQEQLTVAAGQLRLDKLALFPTFTLLPGLSYSKQVESIYTIATQAATGSVGVTVPVLSIPKLLAEVRAQGARGQQAVAAYEKAVQSAYGDAEKALTTIDADRRRVALLDSATKRSRFAFDAATKGYDLGLTDLTSLIQAEQSWRQTRATYTASEISALVDTVATFKALGGGWTAEAAKPDKGQAQTAQKSSR
jgi:NodT family efflux transporter outer membrane factor (OMF) lipoprotein